MLMKLAVSALVASVALGVAVPNSPRAGGGGYSTSGGGSGSSSSSPGYETSSSGSCEDDGSAGGDTKETIYWYTNTSSLTRQNPTYNKTQLNDIKLAMTSNERLALIRSYGNTDDYFKYDFSPTLGAGNAGSGQGGQGLLAQVNNFPVLLGTGISLAMGFLGPCGLDSMHIHNRATELVLLIKGGPLHTSFVMEDGLTDPFNATIGLYQAVIRPQGSIHWEFNDNCHPAVFVAALANEDPGVSRTAQNFFVNPIDLIEGAMGYPKFLNGVTNPKLYDSLPRAFALGAQACLKRCGIKYKPENSPNYPTDTGGTNTNINGTKN